MPEVEGLEDPERSEGRTNPDQHIYWQLQHQLLVSQADLAHLFVFDGAGRGSFWNRNRSRSAGTRFGEDWDRFMDLVRTDERPSADRAPNTVVRTDRGWMRAASEVRLELKKLADDTAAALDAAKQQLIALTRHSSEQGGGLSGPFGAGGAAPISFKKRVQNLPVFECLKRIAPPAREETRVTVSAVAATRGAAVVLLPF